MLPSGMMAFASAVIPSLGRHQRPRPRRFHSRPGPGRAPSFSPADSDWAEIPPSTPARTAMSGRSATPRSRHPFGSRPRFTARFTSPVTALSRNPPTVERRGLTATPALGATHSSWAWPATASVCLPPDSITTYGPCQRQWRHNARCYSVVQPPERMRDFVRRIDVPQLLVGHSLYMPIK